MTTQPISQCVASTSQGPSSLCSFFALQVSTAILTRFTASTLRVHAAQLDAWLAEAKDAFTNGGTPLDVDQIAAYLTASVSDVTCVLDLCHSKNDVLRKLNERDTCIIAIMVTCGKTLTVYSNHDIFVVFDSHAPRAVAMTFLSAEDALSEVFARTNFGAIADAPEMNYMDVAWVKPNKGAMCFVEVQSSS
jgi:hypothetical protein